MSITRGTETDNPHSREHNLNEKAITFGGVCPVARQHGMSARDVSMPAAVIAGRLG